VSDEYPDSDTYALKSGDIPTIAAPDIDYRPPEPISYRPRIALIGAGGIAASHLDAYRQAGWDVAAICNRTLSKAEARAKEFYPDAFVTEDVEKILTDARFDVVDITPHPTERVPLIEAALKAGKHVLSQKPFVQDLDTGERLVRLADQMGCKLAINQNGRWSPHMAWMRNAVRDGLVGDVISCHNSIHWDHGWIAGTPFENDKNLVLYDFGIHWFDFLMSIAGDRVRSVFATASHGKGQAAAVPLAAQAMVRLQDGQASLVFDGATALGPRDTTVITGTRGTIVSEGPDLGTQGITLTTQDGRASVELDGTWFNDGFRGAMGELLLAIEQDREPENGAQDNLQSLALAFAAVESSYAGIEVPVGSVKKLPS
jgi:predicted dehydrogenase